MLDASDVLHVIGDNGIEIEMARVGRVAEYRVPVRLHVVEREIRRVFPEQRRIRERVADGQQRVLKCCVLERAPPIGVALGPTAVVAAPRTKLVTVKHVGELPPLMRFREVVP